MKQGRRVTRIGAWLLLAMAPVLAAPGCNIGVPALYVLHGPPKIQAVTKLDESRRTVIFIDDPMNIIPRRALRTQIAQAAERRILEEKLVQQNLLVSSVSILRAASADSADDPASVVDLGRQVGAEVVIYVQMTQWTLARTPTHLSPTAGATVKIFDTVENKRIWPDDAAGFPFGTEMPDRTEQTSLSPAERNQWERNLAEDFGITLAQLFYTRERDPMSTRR